MIDSHQRSSKTDVSNYAIDDLVLKAKLQSMRKGIVAIWLIFILVSAMILVYEKLNGLEFFRWQYVVPAALGLGVLLYYLNRLLVSKHLSECLGSKFSLVGKQCCILRPNRQNYQEVQFDLSILRDVYFTQKTLTLVFLEKQPWLRNPFPGFYPSLQLIGIRNGQDLARTISVRSGIAEENRRKMKQLKSRLRVGWVIVFFGLILILAAIFYQLVSINVGAYLICGLLIMMLVLLEATLQIFLKRCKLRVMYKRRVHSRQT